MTGERLSMGEAMASPFVRTEEVWGAISRAGVLMSAREAFGRSILSFLPERASHENFAAYCETARGRVFRSRQRLSPRPICNGLFGALQLR